MIATLLRQLVGLAAATIVTIAPMIAPWAGAWAADASPWDADARAGVRLIAGGATRALDTPLRAGVELKLAPGWKTYWRYPGDSGVPPRFDFAGSQNVKSVEIAWPAPHRFTDESGTSIGYKGGVVFPLHIVPLNAAKPVLLHLKLDYAVCEKLCVPAEGRAELALDSAGQTFDAELDAAEATVPKHAKLGDRAPLAVRAVRREGDGNHPRIIVDVAAPDAPLDLFAEGPTPEWALPVPEPAPGAPAGRHRFAFTLDGVPPGANPKGATLTFTLKAGPNAIEVAAHLD
jgi:DsbC/DsbD-like thiol-disulfide interchange protein